MVAFIESKCAPAVMIEENIFVVGGEGIASVIVREHVPFIVSVPLPGHARSHDVVQDKNIGTVVRLDGRRINSVYGDVRKQVIIR